MKRIVTTITLILIVGGQIYSQPFHGFSARVALASTNYWLTLDNGENVVSSSRLNLPNFGLLVDLFASNHFSFVTGLEYQQRGAGSSLPYINSWLLRPDSFGVGTFRYLSVPALCRLAYRFDNLVPYALAGCSLNLGLDPFSQTSPVLDATFGLGLKMEDVLPMPFYIESRYYVNITPAFAQDFVVGYSSVRCNAFDIGLGISL